MRIPTLLEVFGISEDETFRQPKSVADLKAVIELHPNEGPDFDEDETTRLRYLSFVRHGKVRPDDKVAFDPRKIPELKHDEKGYWRVSGPNPATGETYVIHSKTRRAKSVPDSWFGKLLDFYPKEHWTNTQKGKINISNMPKPGEMPLDGPAANERKTPSISEVFGLNEANVTTLAQMNKIPLHVADEINKRDRVNAPTHAKFLAQIFRDEWDKCLDRYKARPAEEHEIFADISRVQYYFNEFSSIKSMLSTVSPGSKKRKELEGKIWDVLTGVNRETRSSTIYAKADALTDMWNELRAEDHLADPDALRARSEMKFPDGFFWIKLKREECSLEGGLMQHCGVGNGDLYSLRDPQGKPHVTLDVEDLGEDGGGLVATQVRGKQNSEPDRKYWKYIKDFLDKKDIVAHDEHLAAGAEGMKLLNYLSDIED